MGWAKKNLSDADRERIAGELFAIDEQLSDREKGWLNGKCPLHDDGNPSFGYHLPDDVFHCHAGCTKDGDLVDLFRLVKGLDSKAGLIEFKKFYGNGGADRREQGESTGRSKGGAGGKGETAGAAGGPEQGSKDADDAAKTYKVDVALMRDVYQKFPPLPEQWLARLERERGWSRAVIEQLGIRLQSYYWDKKTGTVKPCAKSYARIAMPVHYDGQLVNIRLYHPDGKDPKIINFGKGVGESRIYPCPGKRQRGLIWLCEGESDTNCARSLGLNAYTQTSKLVEWPQEQLEPFRGCDIIIAYDADQPGQNYAKSAAKELLKVAESIRVIKWPSFMVGEDGQLPEKHGQDLTDFIVRHGKTRRDLEALLPVSAGVSSDNLDFLCELAFFGNGVTGRYGFQAALLARRLMRDNELLSDRAGLLYRWNGRYWEEFEREQLERQAILYLRLEAQMTRVNDAVKQTVSLAIIPHGRKVNDRDGWICIENGMFNTDTFEILPHDRDYYATVMLPVTFDPNNPASCDRWQLFLQQTIKTPGAIEQLQEFFGYCLTRETRYEMALFMIGEGADGKSTTQKVLRAMVGDENCTSVSFEGLDDQFQRAMIYNKVVNLSSEIGSGVMESQWFKKIASGDKITASFKHKDGFDFKPFVKFAFAVNDMPRILDTSDGLFRKMLPIWFKRQFLPGDPDRDPFLEDKLMQEISGIFAWSLVGLARLRKRGAFYTQLEETRRLLTDYRALNNPVCAFVMDTLVPADNSIAEALDKNQLYASYVSYCGKNGYGRHHLGNFWKELKREVANLLRSNLKEHKPRNSDGTRERVVSGVAYRDGFVPPKAGE